MMILGEEYDERWGLSEYDPYDPFWTPSDELDWDGYEDEYSHNHCFPQEW